MNNKKVDECLDKVELALKKGLKFIDKQNEIIKEQGEVISQLTQALVTFKNQSLHGTLN